MVVIHGILSNASDMRMGTTTKRITSSTAQGGGGSFKVRKPMGGELLRCMDGGANH